MSGGKGGGSTSQVTIPEYIEQAAQRNLNKAEGISQIGYTPYYGPDVAAFTPMQQAAFQNTANTANAFGMAAPTTQQDIMGGMNPPTVYANGLSGYSSAPMYEESLAELGRQRPGQKAYIDSFFIDPQTGAAGSNVQPFVDYTQYETAAESARRAVADAASGGGGGGGGSVDTVYTGPSDDYYNNEDIVMSTLGVGGADASFDSPSATGSYGGSLMTGEPSEASSSYFDSVNNGTRNEFGVSSPAVNFPNFDPSDFSSNYGSGPTPTGSTTPSASSSNYTGFTDMIDGGGKGTSGDTYSGGGAVSDLGNSLTTSVDLPGNVISRALNIGAGKKDNSSDGYAGSSGDGTVMCTAYCEMGYLPKAIWALDRRYGVKMYRNDPTLIEGYHMWGVPVANYLRKQTFGAKVLRAIMWPIVKAWAEEMAHNMKPEDYKPNYFGKLIKFVGEPFSRMCAKLKFRKIEEIA
tara:strand:+ start:422 stop:1810 length:1389 start_codon:yes stop_codon:yes gene_type:complete